MNGEPQKYETALPVLKKRLFIAALLLLIASVAWVSQLRKRQFLEKTAIELARAQSGLAKVKAASANRRQALAALQSQFGSGSGRKSPEMILYEKYEDIKATLKPDAITISAISKNSGEASLQLTLAFTNPDFNRLLNMVDSLHSASFPLTPVSSVSATQSGNGGVSYTITGKIITVERPK